MDYDDSNNREKRFRSHYLGRRGIFNPLVDYYNRFGQGRDLEQYFSLITPSPEPEVGPAVFNSLQEETIYITSQHETNQPIMSEPGASKAPDSGAIGNSEKKADFNLIDLSSDCDSSPRKIDDYQSGNPDTSIKHGSPTESVSSHRKLEWDSLADVGYDNEGSSRNLLTSIEKIALKHRFKDQHNNLVPSNKSEQHIVVNNEEIINLGKPSGQSTPLSTAENTPQYPTIINKKKSILKSVTHKVRPINNKTSSKSNPKNKLKERVIREEIVSFLNSHKTQQPSNINVNLTKHYNLNLEFDRKTGLSNIDTSSHQSKDNVENLQESVIIEETIAPEVDKEPTTRSTCSKIIQTSVQEHASVSVQTSNLSDEDINVSENKMPVPFVPKSSGNILSHLPFIVNVKSPGMFAFKLPRRRPYRDKHTKDSKLKDRPTPLADNQKRDDHHHTSSSKQQIQKTTDALLSRADSFEYMPGHMYQIEKPLNNPPVEVADVSSKFTSTASSRRISSSSDAPIKPKEVPTYSMRQDLEKSVSLLNKILDAHHKDAALKKQLVKNVVKKLLKTRCSEDDTSSEVLSGLSFQSSKFGLLHESSSGRSTTSASNNDDQHSLKQHSKKIHMDKKKNSVEVIYPRDGTDNNKFFDSRSSSSRNESSDRSNNRISFQEWMKPTTKSEKFYMLKVEKSKVRQYLDKRNNITKKKSDAKLENSSSQSVLKTQCQCESSQPVCIDAQIQIDKDLQSSYLDHSLNRGITQLNHLQNEIKNICSETQYTNDIPKITSLLSEVVKVSSQIAKRRMPKTQKETEDIKETGNLFAIPANSSFTNESPTEVPPLNLKKSSDESSSAAEVSHGTKNEDKENSPVFSYYVPPKSHSFKEGELYEPKLQTSSADYRESTHSDIIDKIFFESLHPQTLDKKDPNPQPGEPSLIDSYEYINVENGKNKIGNEQLLKEMKGADVYNYKVKSHTYPTSGRPILTSQRSAYTLENANSIPGQKIDLNIKVLSNKHLDQDNLSNKRQFKKSQKSQTERIMQNKEPTVFTDGNENADSDDVYVSNSLHDLRSSLRKSQEIQTELSAKNNGQVVNRNAYQQTDFENTDHYNSQRSSDNKKKEAVSSIDQIPADALSELIACLHKTFIRLKSGGSGDSDLNSKVRSNSDSKKKGSNNVSKFAKPGECIKEGDNDNLISIPGSSFNNESLIRSKIITSHSTETKYNEKSEEEREVLAKDESEDRNQPAAASAKQQKSSKKNEKRSNVDRKSSSSSLEIDEKTSLDLIRDLIKEYKYTVGKRRPTEEFSGILMEIFKREYDKMIKDSDNILKHSKKTHNKNSKKNRDSPCRNPMCKAGQKSADSSEVDSLGSASNDKSKCRHCKRYKVLPSPKAAFILCPRYNIPQLICPCHHDQFHHLYSKILEQTECQCSVHKTHGMHCHCRSYNANQTRKQPQSNTTQIQNYPKPVAYNLIIEPSSAIKMQNRKIKKKSLRDVVVKVPKFGEWFNYYENDDIQGENNKENIYKSNGDKSTSETIHKAKFDRDVSKNGFHPVGKQDVSSQCEYIRRSTTCNKCRTCDRNVCKCNHEKVYIDSRTTSKDIETTDNKIEDDIAVSTNIQSNSSESSELSNHLTLQDHLESNKKDFVNAAEHRRALIKKNGEERKKATDEMSNAMASLGLSSYKELRDLYRIIPDGQVKIQGPLCKEKEIKEHTLRMVRNLPEKRQQNERIKKEAKQKINLMRAQIFKKKLQMKTLRGAVNIPICTTLMRL